jgi:diacylglycerol kinase family enzyme
MANVATNDIAANAPLCVFINGASGSKEVEQLTALLERDIPAERRGGIFVAAGPETIADTLQQAIAACVEQRGILTLAGGDGTLNSVLPTVLERQLTIGLIPRGTFNYFGRAHGIATEPEQALAQLLSARPAALPVCWLNELPFLINASLGLYPRVIAERERHQQLTWRSRPTALVSGLITLLRERRAFAVQMTVDGASCALKTTLIFASNNRLQLETLKLAHGGCLEQGKLALLVLQPLSLWGKLALLARGATGQLAEHEQLDCLCAETIELRLRKPIWSVALDGELKQCRQPLRIRIEPGALRFMLPETETA